MPGLQAAALELTRRMRGRKKGKWRKRGDPVRVELSMKDMEAILEHAKAALNAREFAALEGAIRTLYLLTQELEKKSVSIQRLKQMLFGSTTESTGKVIQKILDRVAKGTIPPAETPVGASGASPPAAGGTEPVAAERSKGHGHNGAAAYRGAKKVRVPLGSLRAGDACPHCAKGRVYASCRPGFLVRLTGQAPVGAVVYELEKLRCSLCGEVFTAESPEGVGDQKYDAESAAMIGLLKYGSGLPFHRLEKLQDGLGIPLPAATQWEIVQQTAGILAPALEELIRLAAQGQVLFNDDTTMKVLGLAGGSDQAAEVGRIDGDGSESEQARGRSGVFTSGIISKLADHQIALFFTGRKHAGENLLDLLKHRGSELGPAIQMCDALSRNMPREMRTILANCLAHARRKFVDVAGNFPDQCLHVLEILKDVYGNDALAREQGMSAEQRLEYHQAHSGPKMAELEDWMRQQISKSRSSPTAAWARPLHTCENTGRN